jgi:hypothetical protein
MTPLFIATIQAGELAFNDRLKFGFHLQSLEGKRVTVTVEKEKRKRSNQQSKYYWGCVLQLIGEHSGEDPENIHEALKAHFAPQARRREHCNSVRNPLPRHDRFFPLRGEGRAVGGGRFEPYNSIARTGCSLNSDGSLC